MNFDKKTIKEEINLVLKAIEDESAKEDLINYLNPMVNFVGLNFLENYSLKEELSLSKEQKENIFRESWKYLDFALNKYKEKSLKMLNSESAESDSYLFSEYFAWFVKQAILEYLQENFK